jgi:hypothetical protein
MVCLSMQGQIVPGYQGKKTIVSYHMNMSPALDRPTYLNRVRTTTLYPKAKASIFVPFNFTHGISFERVTGRQFSFELDYNFAAAKEYINFSQKYIDDKTKLETTVLFNDIKVNVYGHYFTASALFYGNNSLAPFGKYFKFSFGRCLMYSQFTEDSYISEPTSTNSINTVYTVQTKDVHYGLLAAHFGLGFGSNRIYNNRWVVSKGVSFSYVFEPDYRSYDSDNVYERMYTRVRAHDLLTIFIKIGYLL